MIDPSRRIFLWLKHQQLNLSNSHETFSGTVGVREVVRMNILDMVEVMAERSGLCMARLDANRRIVDVNDEFVLRFGGSPDTLRGRGFLDLLHPDVHAPMNRRFDQLAAGYATFDERVDGTDTEFVGRVTGIAIRGESGELVATVVVVIPEKSTDFQLGEVDARILEGIANGDSTVRIAGRLFLSRQGVEYHVGAMLRRLGVPNRAALVSKAFSMGLFRAAVWPPQVQSAYVN
jgi:PAS domain S-box-containing protein